MSFNINNSKQINNIVFIALIIRLIYICILIVFETLITFVINAII